MSVGTGHSGHLGWSPMPPISAQRDGAGSVWEAGGTWRRPASPSVSRMPLSAGTQGLAREARGGCPGPGGRGRGDACVDGLGGMAVRAARPLATLGPKSRRACKWPAHWGAWERPQPHTRHLPRAPDRRARHGAHAGQRGAWLGPIPAPSPRLSHRAPPAPGRPHLVAEGSRRAALGPGEGWWAPSTGWLTLGQGGHSPGCTAPGRGQRRPVGEGRPALGATPVSELGPEAAVSAEALRTGSR